MKALQAKGTLGILTVAAAAISAAAAQPAAAQQWDPCIVTPPLAECTGAVSPDPLPNMTTAEIGDSCSNTQRFVFAVNTAGQTLMCQGEPGRYAAAPAEVVGERAAGSPCAEGQLAQTPDGSPLQCAAAKNGSSVWTVFRVDSPAGTPREWQPAPVVVRR